jgi:hypothetical protein
MITRYSRPEMRGIWTDENRLKIWLQIELLASEALVQQSIVPRTDFQRIKAGVDYFFNHLAELVEQQKELEKKLNHDVIAFTTAVAEKINHRASRWFHFGLTSSDVVDTAFAVQMVQSADILIADAADLRKIIARRAKEHMLTPSIGRSHGVHAEPTTFGLKLALMYDELGRTEERLKRACEVAAVGKLSGAVGTNARYWLGKLGIDRARVVAISAAGHVGIELARRHPDRVERISFESSVALPWSAGMRLGGRVLFGPLQPLVWGTTRASLRIAPSVGLLLQLTQQTTLDARRVVRGMSDETRDDYLAAFRSLWSGRGFVSDLSHDSPSDDPILQPTLILRGAHDRPVPPAHAARLASLAPDHELAEVDAESHFIWFGRAAGEVWDRRLAFMRG